MRQYGPLRVFPRIVVAMFKTVPIASTIIVLNVIWQGIFVGISFWLTRKTLDSIIQYGTQPHTSFWSGPGQWLVVSALLLSLNAIIFQSSYYINSYAEKRTKLHIQEQLLRKTTNMPLSSFENSKFQDDLMNANASLNIFLVVFLTSFSVVQALIGMVTTMFIFFSYSWLLLVGLIIISIPPLLSRIYFAKKVFNMEQYMVQKKRLADYLQSVLSERKHAKEIRLFNIGNYIAKRWLNISQSYAKAHLNTVKKREGITFIVQLFTSLFYIFCIIIIADSTMKQVLSIGLFVALVQAVRNFQGLFDLLSSQLAIYIELASHVGNAFKFIDQENPSNQGSKRLSSSRFLIEFDNVSFIYPETNKYVLKNVSFVINEGEKIALLGENGAGKSTLSKLILGIYQPTSGVIRINGVDITQLDVSHLQTKFTAVFQDFVQYHLKIRENIGFGDVSSMCNDLKLVDAASKVKADEFINASPNGLDTQLGNQFSNGIDLSGGQWQKLAMARGHLRDASLTVLDEPTSGLDPLAEIEVYKQFLELASTSTTLFISHRIGLARLADRIFVLKDGALIEDGNHKELLTSNGEYADFFKSQAQWYT